MEICPDGLKKHTRVPLSKARSRPRFEPEIFRKKVRNNTDLFGDEQF